MKKQMIGIMLGLLLMSSTAACGKVASATVISGVAEYNGDGSETVTTEQISAEINAMLSEYKDFGVTYDEKTNQWFLDGEKVRYFCDVLTSNGESLNSGKFHGTLRTLESGDGTIDIYTVRDFDTPNPEGYGTLTDIKAYSQEEFDEHTNANK